MEEIERLSNGSALSDNFHTYSEGVVQLLAKFWKHPFGNGIQKK